VLVAVEQPHWVVDGNYAAVRDIIWPRNRETIANALFDPTGIPWWVIRTHAKRRRDYPALLRRPAYSHATVIQLRTPAAAEAFVAATRASGTLIASHP
jgi:hypothetical protein